MLFRSEDEAASRLHCFIETRDGKYFLLDNESTNGTFLNDEKVKESPLKTGDRIGIGDTVILVRLSQTVQQSPTVIFSDIGESDDVAMNVRLDTSSSQFLAIDPRTIDSATQQSFVLLYEFTSEVSASLETGRILDILLDYIFKATHADRAFILMMDEEGKVAPRRSRIRDDEPADDKRRASGGAEVTLPRSMINYVLKTGEAMLTMDAGSDARFQESQSASRLRINSVMAAPFKMKDRMLGIVYVDTVKRSAPFTETDLKLLTVMTMQSAVFFENAKLYEELMDSTEYAASILGSMSSGVIVVDTAGIVTRLNDAAVKILEMQDAAIIGHPIRDFKTLNELSRLLAQTLNAGVPSNRNERVIRLSGREIVIEISTAPLKNHNGEIVGVIANFQNISKIKKMAEEAKQNRYMVSLGEMAASIAHEIRNPLNSIRGFAQLLNDRTDKPESREFCCIILEEVDRMDRIVQDLLDFSRNRDLTLMPTDVGAVVQDVGREFQTMMESAKVVMTVNSSDAPPLALGNADKLHQVFANIIRNAIQAMPDGGTLTVDIGREPAEGMNLIHIRFADTGSGMTPDVLSRIFNPFYTTKDVGTGLGLSICQKIIEKHGGRITASSEPGQGSAFDIFLPQAP